MSTASNGHFAFNQTASKRTDRDLDVAIIGDGFFKVQLSNGAAAYTRNGAFSLDADGNLIACYVGLKPVSASTALGYKLFDNINLPVDADKIIIDQDGAISYIKNGSTVNTGQRLKLYRFLYTSYLTSIGDDLFVANDQTGSEYAVDLTDEDETASIEQGRLDTMILNVRGTKQDNVLENTNVHLVFGDPNSRLTFNQGLLSTTGVSTNVALNGEGFFKIRLNNGEAIYTRDGSFVLDADGNLVTADGYPLYDNVNIPVNAESISVASDGAVSYTLDGNIHNAGSIRVYTLDNPSGLVSIDSIGKNLYRATEYVGSDHLVSNPSLVQNFVELNSATYIKNLGSRVSIGAGEGNDSITNREAMVTIDGGDGNDTIYNTNMISMLDAPLPTLVSTGKITDLAISGEGYFKVELADGDAAYTRVGSFTRDSNGDLVTSDGYPLYDNVNIPYYVDTDTFAVDWNGAVDYDQSWGTKPEQSVNVYIFANPDGLEEIGNNLYKATELSGFSARLNFNDSLQTTAIVQGALEGSVIREESDYLTIVDGGTGNDSIVNALGDMVLVRGGQGSDTIRNSGSYSTINGGSGNDVIYNFVGAVDTSGIVKETGNTTSLAIGGDGYFRITLSDGSTAYTRDGDFHINSAGYFVTADGYALADGIHIPLHVARSTIVVTRDGSVSYMYHGQRVSGGNITAYRFNNPDELQSLGNNLYRATSTSGSATAIDFSASGETSFLIQGAAERFGVETIDGKGVHTSIDGGTGNDTIINNSPGATIRAGQANDIVSLGSSAQVIEFAANDGDDTIIGFDVDDTIHFIDTEIANSKLDGSDVVLYASGGSMVIKGGASMRLNVLDQNGNLTSSLYGRASVEVGGDTLISGDTLASGIVYKRSRPREVIINSPFTGLVDAANFSDRVTKLDASNDDQPVVLLANDNRASQLYAGSGGSTLIGSRLNDKMYGGVGADVFVYTVGGGDDLIGMKKSGQETLCCAAEDKVVILSRTPMSAEDLSFTDRRKVVTVEFEGSKNKLTINKADSLDAVSFYFGSDYESALASEPFTYGLTSDVSLSSSGKVLKIRSTVTKALTLDVSDIISTAKTIDGSAARGKVHIIGNEQPNVIIASNYGSTLDGGWIDDKNRGTADKFYGGAGADLFIVDGVSNDVIYGYGAGDTIELRTGEITDGRLSGKNVTLKMGSKTLVLKSALGETITLRDGNGQVSTYQFTKTSRTLDKALVSTGAQLPSEEFGLELDGLLSVGGGVDPLEEIMDSGSALGDLPTDFEPREWTELAISATRSKKSRVSDL